MTSQAEVIGTPAGFDLSPMFGIQNIALIIFLLGLVGVVIYIFVVKSLDQQNPRVKFVIFDKGTFSYPVFRRLKNGMQIYPDDMIMLMMNKRVPGLGIEKFPYFIEKKTGQRVYFARKLPDNELAPMSEGEERKVNPVGYMLNERGEKVYYKAGPDQGTGLIPYNIDDTLDELTMKVYKDAKQVANEYIEVQDITEKINKETNPIINAIIPGIVSIISLVVLSVFFYMFLSTIIPFLGKLLDISNDVSKNLVQATSNMQAIVGSGTNGTITVNGRVYYPIVGAAGTTSNTSIPSGASGLPTNAKP